MDRGTHFKGDKVPNNDLNSFINEYPAVLPESQTIFEARIRDYTLSKNEKRMEGN